MPRVRLSDPKVKALEEPGDYWDAQEPGLILKVNQGGSKAWSVRYRAKGRYRRFKIGSYPIKGLSEARRGAKRILSAIQSGADPQADRLKERMEGKALTLKGLIAEFTNHPSRKKQKKWKQEKRVFENHIPAALAKRTVEEVSRMDFVNLLDDIGQQKPGSARELHKYLKVMFAWALNRERIKVSPVETIRRPSGNEPRQRTLKDWEIAALWPVWLDMGYPFGDWLRLLLITGQRRSEVAQIRWRDIDMDRATWTIPVAANMANKPKREHEVPLSKMAIEILSPILRIGGPYVFTSNGKTHIQGFSKSKAEIDKIISEQRSRDGLEPLEKWWIHDLRRTVATGLGNLGIAPHIGELVQNRVSGQLAGVVRTYNRAKYEREKRLALDAWAKHLEETISGKTAKGEKVVSLHG